MSPTAGGRRVPVDHARGLHGYRPGRAEEIRQALIVQFAYWTGMRAGEIFNLTWDKVNLKKKTIKLKGVDTKTLEPRVIFLNQELLAILEKAGKVRAIEHTRVFTYKGRPIASIKTCLGQACHPTAITP